jgi:transcriptional regulator with XRE-family HTH domain
MTFGEKLYKLRKEKGLSQEALAEKLNTSRQAVSKWENDQGFPETEKLLLIGNVFEVSIDYLLKESSQQQSNDINDGYYVSKEMAEGYLLQEKKISKYLALGFSLLILSTVPYFVFKQEPAIYTFLIIIIATLGIGIFVSAAVSTDGSKYKILSKEVLVFDQNYLKELTARYEQIKKKYTAVMIVGFCFIVIGGLSFALEENDIALGTLEPYYPISVVLIAIGVYILARTVPLLDSYRLLAKNEEYISRLGFKLKKKVRKKVDGL